MFTYNHTIKPILNRLGSMPVAILLLVLLAVASVIGTVLKQNQEQADYLHQFGPTWYWTFRALGLFDMYHTWWFLAILGLLMASLFACLLHNIPRFLQQMKNRKTTVSDNARKHMAHKFDLTLDDKDKAVSTIKSSLPGWKWMETTIGETLWLRGDKGRFHKWGYILVHSAMLVILVGGWMSVQFGFRGSMSVVEGGSASTIFYVKGTGFEQLDMPFEVRCNDFSVNFFSTGAPSEFRSNLTILEDGKEMMTSEIIVNEPLYYKGVRIYQASFGDGGSDVEVNLFRLDGSGKVDVAQGQVNTMFEDPYSDVSLEFRDFRKYNIENMAGRGEPKDFKDLGASVDFVIRDTGKKAVLVRSFQDPFMMGDQNNGSFIQLSYSGQVRDFESYSLGLDFSDSREWEVYQKFVAYLEASVNEVPSKEKNRDAFLEIVDGIYTVDYKWDDNEKTMLANRVFRAMQVLPEVPWLVVPMLADYEQRHTTGLQLAKDPGMDVVWIGSALLVFGLCIMFYVAHRKVWIRIEDVDGAAAIQVTGLSNRNPIAFEQEFEDLEQQIKTAYGLEPEQKNSQGNEV